MSKEIMTKGQLVDMNNRFIRILNGLIEGYEKLKLTKRYITVIDEGSEDYSIYQYDTENELIEAVQERIEEFEGDDEFWGIYDLANAQELEYKVSATISVKEVI